MKKLLLGTAAVALGMTFAVGHANAQVKLDLGGYTKLYGTWVDQDEQGDDATTAADDSLEVRDLDMARDTEIHFTGETTLDNGLTVGFHTEAHTDGSDAAGGGDDFNVEESYAYFSGAWGRVNFGAEDGATYLLQVAAPSADTNYDGLRQYVNPIRHTAFQGNNGVISDTVLIGDVFGGGAGSAFAAAGANGFANDVGARGASVGDTHFGGNAGVLGALARAQDYDHDTSGFENKWTYMTPVFNGFQAGFSYTPESLDSGAGLGLAGGGNNLDDTIGNFGEDYELAARWEGQFNQLGVAFGGGWSHMELEADVVPTAAGAEAVFWTDIDGDGAFDVGETSATMDDREAWNVGLDLDWMAFGLGAVYMNDDNGVTGDDFETETWALGADYTTGPFKLGVSYFNQDQNFAGAEVETDRYTGGVVYTYGPGMTFRGSVSWADFDESIGTAAVGSATGSSADATSVLLGTQIDF